MDSLQTYYYADAQKTTQGPVTLEALSQLANSGVLTPQSPVIEHGGKAWKTWEQFRPQSTPIQAIPATDIAAPLPVRTAPEPTVTQSGAEAVKHARRMMQTAVKREQGLGFFGILMGLILALVELFILPYRVFIRAMRDLSTWGRSGTLPLGATDIPVLTYWAVVLRPVNHLLFTLLWVLAAIVALFGPIFEHQSVVNSIIQSFSYLFAAYFFNLVIALGFELVGMFINLLNYVKKIADKSGNVI